MKKSIAKTSSRKSRAAQKRGLDATKGAGTNAGRVVNGVDNEALEVFREAARRGFKGVERTRRFLSLHEQLTRSASSPAFRSPDKASHHPI